MNEQFLQSKRNRSLIGLAGAIPIAVIAVVLFEGAMMWTLLALAVVDVVVTPYILGLAVEETSETTY